MTDQLGRQLGNYTLLRLLGTGGFAEVYLGEHIYLKSLAAIKVMPTQLGNEDINHFISEARLLVGLRHPHIVRVLEFGVEKNTPFLIMDYAPNGTLRQRYPKGVRLTPETVVMYVRQIASALQYAHNQKLIHRDVKPENLLLYSNDEILLSDFGIALIAQTSRQQSTQGVIGTATYMAPEQIQGKPTIASDQYSLGIVVYEWLSGLSPFQGSFTEICAQHIFTPPPPLLKMLPTLSPAIENVVMTALAKEQNKRFANVEAFANALEQACQIDKPTQASYTSSSSRFATIPSPQEREATFILPPSEPISPAAYSVLSPPPPPPDRDRPYSNENFAQASNRNMSSSRKNSLFLKKQEKIYPANNEYTYSPTHPVTEHKLRRRTLPMSFVALLIVLVVLMGGLGFFYYAFSSSHASHSLVNGLSTRQVLTPTPLPTPSPTPLPTLSPTPPPTPTPVPQQSGGNLVLNDPLNAPSANKWDVVSYGNNNKCVYTNGSYHSIAMQTGSINFCMAEATNFSDFTYQVSMTILSGTTGDGGGIIFRSKYRLRVGTDGSFDLVNGTSTLFTGSSPVFKTGLNQTNTLMIKTQGTKISFYINNVFIQQTTDSLSLSGPIGVFAVEFTDPTEVAFSHALVWQ